tara:strand:- start:361 stop:576 length:216 start_codon:yes stop_codon:yes gene_type:complete
MGTTLPGTGQRIFPFSQDEDGLREVAAVEQCVVGEVQVTVDDQRRRVIGRGHVIESACVSQSVCVSLRASA